MRFPALRALLVSLILLSLGRAPPALAQSGSADLVGENPGQSAKELRRLGYMRESRDTRAGITHEYWWSPSRQRCMEVSIERGLVSQVARVPAAGCGQTANTWRRTPTQREYESEQGLRRTSREREIEREREYRRRFDADDVIGDRTMDADDDLQRDGFRYLYAGKVKGEYVRSYWNPSSRQCIDVVLTQQKDGRVKDVRHLSDDACI